MNKSPLVFVPDTVKDKMKCTESTSTESMEILRREHEDLQKLLASIERKIFECEEQYILCTPHGNIVKGWDGFLECKPSVMLKPKIEIKDRIFTHSSYSFWRVYMKYNKQQNRRRHSSHHHTHRQRREMDSADAVESDASTTIPEITPVKRQKPTDDMNAIESIDERPKDDGYENSKRIRLWSLSNNQSS